MGARTIACAWCVALLAAACGGGDDSEPTGPVDMLSHVDPFIGTGGVGFGVGSTYPGPALPFAMIHPGPDTRLAAGAPGFSHCSGYWWEDDFIEAFSLMRMNGTGVPDYGIIGFMPVDGMTAARTDESGYMTRFSHDDEEASPGYYRVRMDNDIQVEITSTERAAQFRIEFPEGVDPVLLIDLEHTIGSGVSGGGDIDIDTATNTLDLRMLNNGEFANRFGGFEMFSRAVVDVTPEEVGVWDEGGLKSGQTSASGVDLGGWLRFPAGTRTVHMRVAVSFVDAAGAAANLEAEAPAFDFDGTRTAAETLWRQELDVVTLEGISARDATLFATSLYRAKLMPTLISDRDGRYRDANGDIATATRMRYSDFSLWDTYRTLHPWLLFTEDARNQDFAESLLAFAEVAGAFPRWQLAHGDVRSMVGTPSDFVLAESALKGVSFDEQRAFDIAKVTAYGPAPGEAGGRSAPTNYIDYGYVPHDLHGGSVSETLEYASADYALSMWATRVGDSTTAADLLTRSGNWKNHWHAESGFLRPLDSNGEWVRWLGPTQEHDAYVEGTAWQYLWMVPHDLAGLQEILGGRDAALAKLRTFFTESENESPALGLRLYYWHGNEPDIIAPWIFAAWGSPAESVRWINWVVEEHYGLEADGLPGNDDGGTLSAWLLFAASGIYPIAGTDRYIVAAPRQRLMILHRPGGDLRIEASEDPASHPVPVRVTLDGVEVEGNELTHAQLAGARTLRFEMAAQ